MSEGKYFSKEAAMEAIIEKGQSSRRYKLGEIWELNFEEIREALDDVPAADVRTVVEAGWVKAINPNYSPFDGSSEYTYYCSNCGKTHETKSAFCEHCGASMTK